MKSIAACFWQHVGQPLDPLIPLHNFPTPPAVVNDKIGLTEVDQNNPPGNAAELDNSWVIFYNTLTALPALNDSAKDNDNDDASSNALGLLADGSNVAALTTVGHLADVINAPLALAATLGSPADRSNLLEDADATGAGLGSVNGNPVGDGATGDNGALSLPANGSLAPPALVTAPAIFLGSNDAMEEGSGGNVGTPIDDSATGDRPIGVTVTGGINPSASHTALDSSDNGNDAPPEFSTDIGLPDNGSGSSEAGATMDTGSGSTNGAPTLQSPLYPLFCWGNAGSGQRLVLAIVAWNAAWSESFVLVTVGGERGWLRGQALLQQPWLHCQ